MNYTPAQYAEVILNALSGKNESERARIMERFQRLLERHKKTHLRERILAHYERIFLKRSGLRKVDVESASPLPQSVKQEIESIFGGKVLLTEIHKPNLVAGLTIRVDDSILIDASAKRAIDNLFS